MTVSSNKQQAVAALPEGYSMRPVQMDDLDAVTTLVNACSQAFSGIDDVSADTINKEWSTPGLDLATDTRVVIAPDGQLVGYVDVFDVAEPHVCIWTWGRVHPEQRNKGIGTQLYNFMEQRARQAIELAPQGARIVMQAAAEDKDSSAHKLLRSFDMQAGRHFWDMLIEFDGPPAKAQWPEGVTVRSIAPGEDELEAYKVVRESFKDHWGFLDSPFEEAYERWSHHVYDDPRYDPSLRFLAMDGEQIVGFSMCWPQSDDDPRKGWVDALGVLRPWRRKAGLGVDAESLTGATRLYEKAGMHIYRQFQLYEKELRPGVELSTQSIES